MKRSCRYAPLSKQPLVLVLGQVRFSVVRKMEEYIPAIQEEFRRHGLPMEGVGKVQQVFFTPAGVQTTEESRWEYRSKDERWRVLVLPNCVLLATKEYGRFEDFADKLRLAVSTVLTKTEHDQHGVVHRVGLRYVDLIQPRPRESYRNYLRSGLHGVADEVFLPGSHRASIESVGATTVGDRQGTLIIRVVQNDQGQDLPLDLLEIVQPHVSRAKEGELATLVDMDHYIEGKFEPNTDWVLEQTFRLHDHLIETFHEQVVTKEAVEAWQ